jgi:acetyl-CoA acetyltransferase family protein
MVVLASKYLPITVPGTTVDRQCGSSQQALHFAAQAVMSGTQDMVIAMGLENMSKIPIGSSIIDGLKNGRGRSEESKGIQAKWPDVQFSQFDGAELLAKKHKITREDLDKFGYTSQKRALEATKAGRFKNEIIPMEGKNNKGENVNHVVDEGIRPNVSLEDMSKLKSLREGGVITAATSSQICDGASAILIVNERALKKFNLKPRAKIVQLALAGDSPIIMLEGPIPASQTCLQKAGLRISDIDLYEINEAFAPVPLAWAKVLGADLNKLNVNGGAIALGHALGSSGTRCMTTLLNELERRNGRYGLLAICEGGGTANATIISREVNNSSKL